MASHLCMVLLLTCAAALPTAYAAPLPFKGRMLRLASGSHVPSLFYHGGSLLTSPSLRLHLLWYGTFPSSLKAAITDFISSFQASSQTVPSPSVASWWHTVSFYQDASHAPPSPLLELGSIALNPSYTKGKTLTKTQISTLLEETISSGALPDYNNVSASPQSSADITSIYVVFTAKNVVVEGFCRNSCGFHSTAMSSELPFIWVGNAAKQCVGLCAWPFAVPKYGPPRRPLVAPSGSAATDGMIINLATLLAGIVTNPFGTGYLPNPLDANNSNANRGGGDAEAATACVGMFGNGSYPGYPGKLLRHPTSGAAYNANGLNKRHFLLPALWSPASKTCKPLL